MGRERARSEDTGRAANENQVPSGSSGKAVRYTRRASAGRCRRMTFRFEEGRNVFLADDDSGRRGGKMGGGRHISMAGTGEGGAAGPIPIVHRIEK